MVDLLHQSRRQTDLIPVGRISAGSAAHQFLLGQFALQRIRHRHRRVSRPRNPHGLIHITASGKRIADRSAQTGGRSAERLNLRRMVMGLILKEHKPLLGHRPLAVIHLHRHHHRAGIDLVRLLHILQFAVFLQLAHSHQRQIHQTDELVLSVSEDLLSDSQIVLISLPDRLRVISFPERNLF